MPRPRAIALIRFAASGGFGRLGAWLGVVALVVQLLAPLSSPRADWAEQGLFPPTCSIHLNADGTTDLPGAMDCAQCPLCQLYAATRPLPELERTVEPAFVAPQAVVFPEGGHTLPRVVATQPPLPSRGPPSVA